MCQTRPLARKTFCCKSKRPQLTILTYFNAMAAGRPASCHSHQGLNAGDRVLTTRALAAKGGGGYASKIAAPAADLVRIPDNVTFEQVAATGLTSSTAWGSLFDIGHLQAGEGVLIWAGSSGVGSIAIQFAKHAGCWVVTTASNNEKASELHRLGADMVVNHKEQNVGQVVRDAGGVNLV